MSKTTFSEFKTIIKAINERWRKPSVCFFRNGQAYTAHLYDGSEEYISFCFANGMWYGTSKDLTW